MSDYLIDLSTLLEEMINDIDYLRENKTSPFWSDVKENMAELTDLMGKMEGSN